MTKTKRDNALEEIARIVVGTKVPESDNCAPGLTMVLVLEGPDHALNSDIKQVLYTAEAPDHGGYALYNMPVDVALADKTVLKDSPAMARAARDAARGSPLHTVILYPGLANEDLSPEERQTRFQGLNAQSDDIHASAAVHLLPVQEKDLAVFLQAAPDLLKDARQIHVPAGNKPRWQHLPN